MSTATFIKSDTTTKGTWYNGGTIVYGSDGWNIADYTGGSNPNLPAYATVSLSANTGTAAWFTSTTDTRGLEYPPVGTSTGTDSNRIAATWFDNASTNFTIDVNDGGLHQIALYCMDFDSLGRAETITITDDLNGGITLDSRSIGPFSSGVWLVWQVSGKVTFTITQTSGPNSVVSGIFFDTPGGPWSQGLPLVGCGA